MIVKAALAALAAVALVVAGPVAVSFADGTASGAPTVYSASVNADENSPLLLSAKWSTPDGSIPTSITIVEPPSQGTLQIVETLEMIYTPDPGYIGPDSFTYTASDAAGTSAEAATESINVLGLPVASPSTAEVPENSSNDRILLSLSGGSTTFTQVIHFPAHGTMPVLSYDGSTTYTPDPNYSGQDGFSYLAWGPAGSSAIVVVSITVFPPPDAGPATATVAENSSNNAIALNLSQVPIDSVAVVSPPSDGTTSISGTTISYTPNVGYSGPDGFTYTATNAAGTSLSSTVSITVAPTPVVGPVTATVAENSSANPVNPDLSNAPAASVTIASPPSDGTAWVTGTTIRYTPNVGYSGSDEFTYTVSNAGGTSLPATVTITVNPLPPTVGPVATTVAENSSDDLIPLDLSGEVADSVGIVDNASHGTTTVTGTGITYSPDNGYSGTDTFIYDAENSGGTSVSATVTITVNPLPPTVGAVSTTVSENSSDNTVPLDLGGGAAGSIAVVGNASHGSTSVSGDSILYTPDSNFSGTDTFTYSATNAGGTSVPATVTITVTPVYAHVSTTIADPDGNLTGIDGNALGTVTVTDDSTNDVIPSGSTTREGDDLQFASAGANGYSVANVSYSARCGGKMGGSDDDSVVGPLVGDCVVFATVVADSAPTVAATTATVAANSGPTAISLPITGPDATSVDTVTDVAHGTLIISGATATYTPTAGYSGPDSFSYSATNSAGTSDTATVAITVTPPTVSLSADTVEAGGTITVSGSDFAADEPVTLMLRSTPTLFAVDAAATLTSKSTPVTLGTVTADSSGSFTATVTIPAGTPASQHTLLAIGTTSGTVSTPLTVTVVPTVKVLGFTGGITTTEIVDLIGAAAMLALLGGFLLILARRRKQDEQ